MSAEASVGFAAPDDNSIGPVWSRTVIKAAPTCFTVEVLPPTKQGKAYSYGIRVIPVNPQQLMRLYEGDDFDPDNGSIRSVGREYEIWRRWDDCLDFQSKLETEFERMSREKKRQLQSGKKVNGRTLYSNPNAGASFESLPEGPDPRTVKIDLHAYVPRLTKKSSFFGNVSDATIQKRGEEFAAVIYGLFKADCVKLIEELRDSVPAREFFAWWRRDEDRMEKQGRRPASSLSGSKSAMAPASVSRFSMDTSASTVFTTPSSPDSPGFSMLRRQQKIYQFPQRSPTESSSSPTATSPSIVTKSPQLPIKHLPSPPTSPEQIRPSRSPVPFLGPPTIPQRPVNVGRPMEPMRYPDNRLLSPQSLQPSRPPQLPTPTALSDRGGRFFSPRELQEVGDMHSSGDASSDSSSPPTPTQATFPAEQRRERPVSQMSMESINSIDYNIDLSFIKLDAPPLGTGKARVYGNRDSVASFMSVDSTRTVDSMAGVLPRSLSRQSHVSQRRRRRRDGPWSPDSRLSLAVPEDAEARYYSDEDSLYDGADLESNFDTMSFLDNLDAFPGVPAPPVADDEVMLQYARDRDWRLSFPTSVRDSIAGSEYDMYDVTEPSSPTSTISGVVPLESESGHSTHSAGSNGTVIEPGMCSVKAKYDDTIVALRVPLGTPLSTLRAKLSEKFIQAQGVQLHYRFSIAYFPPSQGLGTGDGMPILISPAALEFEGIPQGSRSSVASSVRPRDSHCESSNLHKLVPIWSQDDWDSALQRCGNKVVLHIIDQDLSP